MSQLSTRTIVLALSFAVMLVAPGNAGAKPGYGAIRTKIQRLRNQLEEVTLARRPAKVIKQVTAELQSLKEELTTQIGAELPSATEEKELGGLMKELLESVTKIQPAHNRAFAIGRRQFTGPRTRRDVSAIRELAAAHNSLAEITEQHFLTAVPRAQIKEIDNRRIPGFPGLRGRDLSDALDRATMSGFLVTTARRYAGAAASTPAARPGTPRVTVDEVLKTKVAGAPPSEAVALVERISGWGLAPQLVEALVDEVIEKRADGSYAIRNDGSKPSPLNGAIGWAVNQKGGIGMGASFNSVAELFRTELPRILRDQLPEHRDAVRTWFEGQIASLEAR